MTSAKVWAVLGVGMLVGCETTAAPPTVMAPAPVVAPAPVIAAAPAACALRYELTVDELGPAQDLGLHAVAVNLTTRPLVLEVADRCPEGVVTFTGLPDGTDPYNACTAGACPADLPPRRFELAPGARVALADVLVPRGGGSCSPALPASIAALGFVPPLAPPDVPTCGPAPVAYAHVAPPSPPARPAPRKPTPSTTSTPAPPPPCPLMPACGIGCPHGMAHDANGCTLCQCAPDPMASLRRSDG